MPSLTELVATVAVVTQFIKQAINSTNWGFLKNLIIEKWAAVVLAILVSFGTVFYHATEAGEPFTFALLILGGKVAVAATMGYSLLKVARGTNGR